MLEVLWLGRGGQGAFTAARLLGLAAVRFAGLQAMAFPSFGPERRGAPVYAYTRIAARPIHDRSAVRHAQIAVILDETLLPQLRRDQLISQPLLLIDGGKQQRGSDIAEQPTDIAWRLPAAALAWEHLGSHHTNTVLIGALNGLLDLLPTDALATAIQHEFAPHWQAPAPLPKRASANLAACQAASHLGANEQAHPLLARWLSTHSALIPQARVGSEDHV